MIFLQALGVFCVAGGFVTLGWALRDAQDHQTITPSDATNWRIRQVQTSNGFVFFADSDGLAWGPFRTEKLASNWINGEVA